MRETVGVKDLLDVYVDCIIQVRERLFMFFLLYLTVVFFFFYEAKILAELLLVIIIFHQIFLVFYDYVGHSKLAGKAARVIQLNVMLGPNIKAAVLVLIIKTIQIIVCPLIMLGNIR